MREMSLMKSVFTKAPFTQCTCNFVGLSYTGKVRSFGAEAKKIERKREKKLPFVDNSVISCF